MNPRAKVLMMLLFLLILPVFAVMAAVPPSYRDPSTPGDGSSCVTSCAELCSNGYWSSIGCLSNQCAHCPCPTSGIPLPYCT